MVLPTCIHREGLGNTREAKTKACKLEVDKRLKRFHSPLENHSSSSASPKVESRQKWRKKNAGERCQQDHGQISRETGRKRRTQETQRRNGGEGPRLVEFSSFTAPKMIPLTTTTTMVTTVNGAHDTGKQLQSKKVSLSRQTDVPFSKYFVPKAKRVPSPSHPTLESKEQRTKTHLCPSWPQSNSQHVAQYCWQR